MCGIAGIAGLETNPERTRRMRDRLRHRGPDDQGLFSDGAVALVNTRLSVIDPSFAGRQPMQSPDGRQVLVYNGEVYDFHDLRESLRGRGHQFRSETDAEVVLHAWMEWGEDALDRLEGMYAFALWDRDKRTLFFVRDRMGIKPLYWHHDGDGTFLFASEVRALLASGFVPRTLNRPALAAFLSHQTVPTPRTLVEGVKMLDPGAVMRVRLTGGKASRPEIHRYWHPVEAAHQQLEAGSSFDRDAAVRGLRERLERAVARRVVADVPLGVFLSGGVDSTAVTGLMARASDVPVRTLTLAFEHEDYTDGPYARLAAEHLRTDHTEIRLSAGELLDSVPAAVSDQDHPSGDGVNTWIVSRAARKAGLTVALSGLGGDELFGGYPTFRRLPLLSLATPFLARVPRPVRSGVGLMIRHLRPGVDGEKIASLLETDGAAKHAYPVLRRVLAPDQVERVIRESGPDAGVQPSEVGSEPWVDLDTIGREGTGFSPLLQASLAELTCYMRDVLLRDTDQMSMAHSLEVRVPFLDREVVEYVLALPDEVRRPSTPPKRFLMDAVDGLIPEPVTTRAKSGFAMPFDRWMRGGLKDFCRDGIRAAAAHPAFRAEAVEDIWNGFLEKDPRVPWARSWLLITLGHWLQREEVE